MADKNYRIPAVHEFDNVVDILTTISSYQECNEPAQKESARMLLKIRGISLDKKPRKDGRYHGRITINGKQRSIYGKNEDEVIMQILDYIKGKTPRKKEKPPKTTKETKRTYTLGEWLDKWFQLYKKPNLKPTSITILEVYIGILKKAFGEIDIKKLDPIALQDYFANYTATESRDRQLMYLNQAIKKAIRLGLIKNNPCDSVEIKKHQTKTKKALTLNQQKLFLQAIEEHPKKPLFMLLLATGLRIGEALALRWADINVTELELTINKCFVWDKGIRYLQPPKTHTSNRVVPIPQSIIDILPKRKTDTDLLFPYTYNAVKLALIRINKSLGIQGFTLHTTRHTYTTRIDEAGVAPKVKQYLLGHATLKMTQDVYTDIQPEFIASQKNTVLNIFDTKTDTKKE